MFKIFVKLLRHDLSCQVGLLNLKTNVVRAGIEGAQLVNSCKLQSMIIVFLSRANMHFEVICHAVIVTIIIFTTVAVLGGEEEEEEEKEKPSSYRRYPSYRRSYYQRPRYYSNGYYRG